jgi:hypothetical protein
VSRYAEGQVWEYRTRRDEERSLVKIQRIEIDPDTHEPIFHISLIGVRLPHATALAHAPVSQNTLDMSVTNLSVDHGQFPTADEGITEWGQAKGGVYSVSLAEMVEIGGFAPAPGQPPRSAMGRKRVLR